MTQIYFDLPRLKDRGPIEAGVLPSVIADKLMTFLG